FRDGTLRQPLAAMKVPNQGPIFHGDHPSDRGWVAWFSTVVSGLIFDRRQQPASRAGIRLQ
ncbi:hypothetical protein AB4Z09_18095, partial [Rhodococcus sp. TAF43]|uniref:hypothetical protein n=1 Tax=Rhodococcus sp. TAF43 TaxID=3237483 RepID=UPI003F9D2CF2